MALKFGDLDSKAQAIAEFKSRRADEVKIKAAMAAIRLKPTGCGEPCPRCSKLPWDHEDGDWACTPIALWRFNLRHLGHKWLSEAMRRILVAEGK